MNLQRNSTATKIICNEKRTATKKSIETFEKNKDFIGNRAGA